jgi:hypothetical protein
MPRIVRTASGKLLDFDALLIKQQLAQAPVNVQVAQRREFIDSKERTRGQKKPEPAIEAPAQQEAPVEPAAPTEGKKK